MGSAIVRDRAYDPSRRSTLRLEAGTVASTEAALYWRTGPDVGDWRTGPDVGDRPADSDVDALERADAGATNWVRRPVRERAPRNVADRTAASQDGKSVDVFRLSVAVFGLALYLGLPAASIGYVVYTFAERFIAP